MNKSSFNNKRIFSLIFGVSIFLNLILFFQIYESGKNKNIEDSAEVAESSKKYPLLAKRILNEFPNDLLINFLGLRSKTKEITQQYDGKFAMYFEYLPTGTSIGINEKDEFFAASLFKLPVVMAYFRDKEQNKITIDRKVKIKPDEIDDRFGTLYQKGAGYEISLDEAARLAIVDSDNTAAKVLGPYISADDFKDVYDAIDIDLKLTDKGAVLTAKHYSSILKALYFAAVLTKDDSQTVLSYLTQSEFTDKLAAGIPLDVPVAHKIGVIEGEAYMDCGIVYVPRRPYLLCMISKSDEKTAQDRMKLISKTVYDFVSKK